MNQLEAGEVPEAPRAASDLQNELAEVLRQRTATSEVLRAIANSPHDLQFISQVILDSAARLCRTDVGSFRLVAKAGLRLLAYKASPAALELYSPPTLLEHDSFIGRLIAKKSVSHFPDLAAPEVFRAGDADLAFTTLVKEGIRTGLYVPMLRNDELIGALSIGRMRVAPFTEREIELVTDFAAEATIALEIVRRERQHDELQTELAHANRVATLGQLLASIAHEVRQPIGAVSINAQAALRFLDRRPAELGEVRQALADIDKDNRRAGDVIGRIRDLIKKAPPRLDRLEINAAIGEVVELTRGEAVKNGVAVQTDLAQNLPLVEGDRVQLQQVMLNLIVNGIEAMSDAEGPRNLLISSEATEDGVRVGVLDSGPGLSPESPPRLFEPFYTTKHDGIGLGLSICRSIIEAHGGRLSATGQPRGALFQFTIPTN